MKTRTFFRNGVALLAIAATMVACGDKNNESANNTENQENSKVESASSLRIAFVQIDTLTNQYEYYKDVSENFEKKRTNAESTVNEKGRSLANQMQEFQKKAQSNQYTQEQFNNEQARLARLQQDIQELQGRLSNSLQEEYQKEMQALTDTIQNFIKIYAKEKGFDFILCKSSGIDNVLSAGDQYDVTDEVVTALNKRYKNAKKADEKK